MLSNVGFIVFYKFTLQVLPKAKYGGRHTVTMLPGGGIGPELMGYVKEVFRYVSLIPYQLSFYLSWWQVGYYIGSLIFRYAGVPVDFEEVNIDPNSEGNEDLEYALTSIKRNGVAIKGKEIPLFNVG